MTVPGKVVGDETPLRENSANPCPDPEEGVEAVKPAPGVNVGSYSTTLTTPRRKAWFVKEVALVDTGVLAPESGIGTPGMTDVAILGENTTLFPWPVPVVAPAVVTPESS
ncbi:MAG: hypothetical protein OK441_04950 [Thaumarchaeota archaeon]|nr:hypothetical protein [Nitrososphaerota archaeon]